MPKQVKIFKVKLRENITQKLFKKKKSYQLGIEELKFLSNVIFVP